MSIPSFSPLHPKRGHIHVATPFHISDGPIVADSPRNTGLLAESSIAPAAPLDSPENAQQAPSKTTRFCSCLDGLLPKCLISFFEWAIGGLHSFFSWLCCTERKPASSDQTPTTPRTATRTLDFSSEDSPPPQSAAARALKDPASARKVGERRNALDSATLLDFSPSGQGAFPSPEMPPSIPLSRDIFRSPSSVTSADIDAEGS